MVTYVGDKDSRTVIRSVINTSLFCKVLQVTTAGYNSDTMLSNGSK